MHLKILNEIEPNVLQYLPFGITTIEMKIEEDNNEADGFMYPINRTNGENKFFVGYADKSNEIIVLWGAGKEDGLQINQKNVRGRLFLQILHQGNDNDKKTISLMHNRLNRPLGTITLEPALENTNVVRMELTQEGEYCKMSFKGNLMPSYYSRWFPPRPSDNNKIQYYDVESPPITINFESKINDDNSSMNVNSDIVISLDNKKIAQITGDWHYSWLHPELFTIFGDSRYIVLRVWLYWIHKNFSRNIFLGGNAFAEKIEEIENAKRKDKLPQDEEVRKGWWESFNIECPDNERFDFLIDMKKERIIWVGTDFHYQESWYKIEEKESFVKARIANDVNTIEQVFKNLKNRFTQVKENYDPMTQLKCIVKEPEKQKNLILIDIPGIKEYTVSNLNYKGDVTYKAAGFTRKHIPYVQNGKLVAELVSSIVTS
jgi:hypothetical protein